MARGSLLSRFRRPRDGNGNGATPEEASEAPPAAVDREAPAADVQAVPPRPLYHPGVLRRERRVLVRTREERIRDLGGLILEMFRRDRFREDLMREQADDIFGIETRIQEIDTLLAAGRRQAPVARCECGAPIVWASHFCANCGRPTGEAVVTCESCGHPLPADARFCANCGTPAAQPRAAEEAAAYKAPPEPAADPWER